jgi:hypothetical protein
MLTETTPLAVWDVREASWFGALRPARAAWLEEHGLPALDLYRVEFYADGPAARLFCFHRNAEGHRHWNDAHVPSPHDHDACGRAVEEPRAVPLSELPPPDLLYV